MGFTRTLPRVTEQHPAGKRVVVREFGESPSDAIEQLISIEEQPFPDVSALQAHDVVIKVKSAAVGWVDLLMTSGQYQHMPSPPYCPGLEYAGQIVWVGADAQSRWRVGDKVIGDGFVVGPRSKGDYQKWGGFATYAVAPANGVMALPESFSFDQGANLLGNYETAYHCLVACGQLIAGETVMIHGATGSTGLAAVHIAKLLGARVIATGRSREKLEEVKRHGADEIVCLAAEEGGIAGLRDRIKTLTDGRGVDVCYDAVGGDLSVESLRCMAFMGRFLIVGWAGTPNVAKGKGGRGAPNVNVLPTNIIMMKGLRVMGCPAVISAHHDPRIREKRLQDIFAWVSAGKISPAVSKVHSFADVKEAMREKWSSRYVGGIVLHPEE